MIAAGGTLETNVGYGSTISGVTPIYAFLDATAGNTLKIDNIGSFGGQILGFGAGDTIDIGAVSGITQAVYSQNTGILNLENATGTIVDSLYFISGNFSSASFNIGTVSGDTVLTTAVQNDVYLNNTGSWQTGANWSNGVPGSADTAFIGAGASAPFTLTTGGAPVSVGELTIAGDRTTVQITSNTTVAPYNVNQFSGKLEVTSGNTLTTSAYRMFGGSALIDAAAELKVTGHTNPTTVGANNGTLTIKNTNSIGVRVASGTLTVNGTIDANPSVSGGGGNIFIGFDGGGTPANVIVQGTTGTAAAVIDTYTQLSSDPTSFGVLTLNGNATWNDTIDPQDPTGTLTSTGKMIVGTNNESNNSGTITPAPFTNAATLLVENGATLGDPNFVNIGNTTNSSGTATIETGGIWNIGTGGLAVGFNGSGALTVQSGGTVAVGSSGISMGSSLATATGTITVSGAGSSLTDAGGINVGKAGSGLLNILNGGTVQITGGGVNAGNAVGSTGSINVSGTDTTTGAHALLSLGSGAKGLTAGSGGQGIVTVGTGGTIQLNGTGGIGVGVSSGAVGLITVSGTGALLSEGATGTGAGIGQAGTGTLQVLNGGGVTLAANSLSIGTGAGSGTVTVDGTGSSIVTQGTSTAAGNINVGSPGTGVLSITNGGSVGASGGVFIANGGTGSVGSVTVNGGTLTAASGIGVGSAGHGTLTLSGSAVVTNTGTNSFNIGGFTAGSSGTVVINSGTLTNTAGGFFVGQTNATGVLQINGGTWTSNGNIIVGDTGGGVLTASGGLVNAGTNFVNIGNQAGGNGTVAVSGGTLEAGNVSVGNGTGIGTLTVSANGLVQVSSLSEGAGGKIDVTGGTIAAGSANLGQSGTNAVMTIGTLGLVSSNSAFNIGTGTSASASVAVNTGGSLSTTNLLIGGGPNASTGTLTVNGGVVSNAGFFNIGQSGSGTLIVQNGGSVVTNSGTFLTAMSVAGTGGALVSINSGQVSLVGGAINLGGSNASGSLSVGAGGTLLTNGTALEEINATGTGTAAATISGGTWNSGGQINVGDSGSGSLDINSNGVVNAGTNSVNIGNQSTGSGTLSVENGGTLIARSLQVSDPVSGSANAILNVGTGGGLVQVSSLNQSGGTINITAGTLTSSGFINLGGTASGAILTIGSAGVVSETGAAAGVNIGPSNDKGSVVVNNGGTLSVAGDLALGTGVSGSSGILSVNGGSVTVGSGIFIGGAGTGTITINGGGAVSNTGINGIGIGNSNGTGVVFVTNGALSDSSGLTIGDQVNAVGTLSVGSTGTVSAGGLLVGTGGVIDMMGGGLSAGGLSQNNGGIDGFGTLIASLNNAGTVTASSGRLVVTGSVGGTGGVAIGTASTLEVDGGLTQGVTFVNSGSATSSEALQLNLLVSSTQSFGLSGWQNGDELFIANGVTVTGANWLGGGTLAVNTTGATYDFTNVTLAAGTTPIFTTGANFVELVSCFVTGTRISTERGEVAVEDLREGDRVQVVLGQQAEPVVWVAHRHIDCARHPEPRLVWPVRIAAGAFGPGRPCRELWLSPDHAVYIGDVLIPVKYLVNGTSIVQVPMDEVTYYHLELPRHSVLLAEGLAAESYLDTGDRSNFANNGGPIALYPDFASRRWDAEGCAPLVVTGPELDAAKRWVNGLAGRVVPAASAA